MTSLEDKIDAAVDLAQSGNAEGAIRAFIALGDENPSDHRFYEEAGNLSFFQLRDPRRAIPLFERALAVVDPDEDESLVADIHCKVGQAHVELRDFGAASAAYARAHAVDPIHVATFLSLAKMHNLQKRHADAIELANTALAQHVMQTVLTGDRSPAIEAQCLYQRAFGELMTAQMDAGLASARSLREMGDERGVEQLAQQLEREQRADASAALRAL